MQAPRAFAPAHAVACLRRAGSGSLAQRETRPSAIGVMLGHSDAGSRQRVARGPRCCVKVCESCWVASKCWHAQSGSGLGVNPTTLAPNLRGEADLHEVRHGGVRRRRISLADTTQFVYARREVVPHTDKCGL